MRNKQVNRLTKAKLDFELGNTNIIKRHNIF